MVSGLGRAGSLATFGIFLMPVWTVIVDTFNRLSGYMGIYNLYIVVFLTLIMFLRFVQFVFRRLSFK